MFLSHLIKRCEEVFEIYGDIDVYIAIGDLNSIKKSKIFAIDIMRTEEEDNSLLLSYYKLTGE